MSVKGDKICYTHIDELLKCQSTVKRFSSGTLMLSSLVKHRHYNADSARLTAYCTDRSLDILKMIVRTHRNGLTVHIISHAMVEYVRDNVNVVTSQGVMNVALCLSASETRADCIYQKRTLGIVATPFLEIKINLVCEILASLHADNAKLSVQAILHFIPPMIFVFVFTTGILYNILRTKSSAIDLKNNSSFVALLIKNIQ